MRQSAQSAAAHTGFFSLGAAHSEKKKRELGLGLLPVASLSLALPRYAALSSSLPERCLMRLLTAAAAVLCGGYLVSGMLEPMEGMASLSGAPSATSSAASAAASASSVDPLGIPDASVHLPALRADSVVSIQAPPRGRAFDGLLSRRRARTAARKVSGQIPVDFDLSNGHDPPVIPEIGQSDQPMIRGASLLPVEPFAQYEKTYYNACTPARVSAVNEFAALDSSPAVSFSES